MVNWLMTSGFIGIVVVANSKMWTPLYIKQCNTLVIHQMDIPCDFLKIKVCILLVKLTSYYSCTHLREVMEHAIRELAW